MERKTRKEENGTEALLQAFRKKMGDSYHIEPSEDDRKEVIFKIIKDGEQEGIILYCRLPAQTDTCAIFDGQPKT